jgi:Ca2+-binding RTX toxin-like protein
MIDVKGTKTTPQEIDPAQRYVLREQERKSKTPYAVGAFLMGVALYLKTIFPSWASIEKPQPKADDETGGEPTQDVASAEGIKPGLDPQPTGTVGAAADGPDGSGGRIVDLAPPARFLSVPSPDVDFIQPEVTINWRDFNPFSLSARVANDNQGGISGPGVKPVVPTPPTKPKPPVIDPEVPGPGGPTDPEGNCPGSCGGSKDCDEDDEEEEPCGGGNRAPRVSGPVYLLDVAGCVMLTIALSDLLRNAVDPDGDTLSVKNLTVSSGTLTQSGDGWVFQGGPQLIGDVTISYQITDGQFSVNQTAHFSVVKSHIGGADGDDLLIGTMCADDIDGGDGDDNIDGRGGNDVISGGRGDDHIVAGAGDDTVFGGADNDIIFGGTGNDYISGGAGNDRLYGEDGDDIIFGDDGDDYLSGGAGDDFLSGGTGNDTIHGDAGNDTILGGAGNDVIHGGAGDDVISDGAGSDRVYGGDGDDHVVAASDRSDDFYSGGKGIDTVDYSVTTSGVSIDLAKGNARGSEIGKDALSGFEVAIGGSGDDTIIGSAQDEILVGNAGDDQIDGGAGNDRVEGGAGNDILSGGKGEDVVLGGAGDDRIIGTADCADDIYDGGEGHDTLDYSATSQGVCIDLVSGQATGVEIGEDTISGFEVAIGGSGDDHFIVGDAPMVLVGGEGSNLFEFAAPAPDVLPLSVLHEILDFKVGDRIRMSKYDLFERVLDELEDQFESIYGDDIDEDDIPIRYRHDRVDEMDRTIIEADFNNDNVYETTIHLVGRHLLVTVETT